MLKTEIKPEISLNLLNEEDNNFYDLEFSNVDNGGRYPGSFTKVEYNIIKNESNGSILHLFSGSSEFGDVRIDLANKNATLNIDVFTYLQEIQFTHFNTCILDPPYNKRFAEKYSKIGNTDPKQQFVIFAQAAKTTLFFNLLRQKIMPDRIIIKSWNWYVPKLYYMKRAVVCYAGGYRKPTFLTILDKIN